MLKSVMGRISHRSDSRADAQSRAEPATLRQMLIPLAAAQFLASYDTSSMNVAISNIVEDLNTTVTGVQTALSLFTLTMAALMIPGSKLTDIWGRKRCFVIGMWTYAAGALLTALAPTLGVMILGFSMLEGIGSALMIPPIYILITVLVKDTTARTKAFATVSAMAGLGAAAGPLIGGIITTTITWRASYAGEVVVIMWILYLSRRIQEPAIEGPKPSMDILGSVLSAAGLVFIVLGFLQAGDYGWFRARQDFAIGGNVLLEEGSISPVVVLIGIGLASLFLFALHIRRAERRGDEPLVPARVFRSRLTNLGLVTQNSQWFIMIGTFFVVSVFLQVSRGYNAIETGLMLTPATAGILLSSSRVSIMLTRFSPRTVIRLGFLVTLAGIAMLVLLERVTDSTLAFAPGLLLIGFGAGSMLTISVDVVQASVPEADQGALSGVSRSVSNLGSSMGTALAGSVLVAAIISGVSTMTAESDALSAEDKASVTAALEGEVSAASDDQVRTLLEGHPPAVVDEVVRINAQARDRALGIAVLAVAFVGLVGFAAAIFMPDNKPGSEALHAY
jgi:MFS family permease